MLRHRLRSATIAAAAAVAVATTCAGGAQASEYHYLIWDISTNLGRACGHDDNGVPYGAPSVSARDIYVSSAIGCNYGSSGQAATLYTSLNLYSGYGTRVPVEGLYVGYGPSWFIGTSSAVGDYDRVDGWVSALNVPTRFDMYPYTTYNLPLSVAEDFTSWPGREDYDCGAYWRLHNPGTGGSGWHRSGLTCVAHGSFTTGVAPYVN